MLKLVIFDLDGVLYDSKEIHFLSFNKAFYRLTLDFVNQRFLPKLANTLDNIRVSLSDKSIL